MKQQEKIEEKIKRLEEELEEAKEELEYLNENTRFRPNIKDTYYYVYDDNTVCSTSFDEYKFCDKDRYDAYNCFQTKEEAQKEYEL